MFKRFIIISALILSFSISANSGTSLVNNVEYQCQEKISEIARKQIDSDQKVERSDYISLGELCSSVILVNNVPNNMFYAVFGEPYKIALNFPLVIGETFFSNYVGNDTKFNFKNSQFEPALKNIEDNFYLKLLNVVFDFIIKLSFLFGLGFMLYAGYLYIFNKSSGNKENDIKKIKYYFFAGSLLAPIPFLDVSLIWFIFYIMLSLGIMLGNMFYFIIYIGLFQAEAANLDEMGYRQSEQQEFVSKALSSDNYTAGLDSLINSQLMLIRTLESDIYKNITDSKLIHKNQSYDFFIKPNFFNCFYNLENNDKYRPTFDGRTKITQDYMFCAENYNYYYDANDNKIDLSLTFRNDYGSYARNISYSLEDINLIKYTEEQTFSVAKQYYYLDCIFNNDKRSGKQTVNREFICVQFDRLGQYDNELVELPSSKHYDIDTLPYLYNAFVEKEKAEREFITFKSKVYENIANEYAKGLSDVNLINNEFQQRALYFADNRLLNTLKTGVFGVHNIVLPKIEFRTNVIFDQAANNWNSIGKENKLIDTQRRSERLKFNYERNTEFRSAQYRTQSNLIKKDMMLENALSNNLVLNDCIRNSNRTCNFTAPLNITTYYYVAGYSSFSTMIYFNLSFGFFSLVSPIFDIFATSSGLKWLLSLNLVFTFIIVFASIAIPMIFFILFYLTVIIKMLFNKIGLPLLIMRFPLEESYSDDEFSTPLQQQVILIMKQALFYPIFIVFVGFVVYLVLYIIAIVISFGLPLIYSSFTFTGIEVIDSMIKTTFSLIVFYTTYFYILIRQRKAINRMTKFLGISFDETFAEEITNQVAGFLKQRTYLGRTIFFKK